MFKTNLTRELSIAALICALCLWNAPATGALSCMDENGKPVDWFMGYKFPPIKGDTKFKTGRAYAFITSNDATEEINDDIQTKRAVDHGESLIFLRRFKDLLTKFAGSFTRRSSKPEARATRSRLQAKNSTPRWVASEKLIDDDESVIMRTMAPAYDHKLSDKIGLVFYNDDPRDTDTDPLLVKSLPGDGDSDDLDDSDSDDEGSVRSRGDDDADGEDAAKRNWNSRPNTVAHAKGAFLMDEDSNTGVWLTHSVPRFPRVRDSLYPKSGKKNAQTFMCITVDLKESGSQLLNHLVNMRPLVYQRRVSESLLAKFPELEDLDTYVNEQKAIKDGLRKRTRSTGRTQLAQTIVTKANQVLKLYSKPGSVEEDLYSGWIVHDLNSDMYVETWRSGVGGKLDSSCPKGDYKVNNVLDLKYSDTLTWNYTKDHSKWAMSDQEDAATVCIGDANRMLSQYKRGSGAVCIRCPTCWSIFSATIADTEPCPVPRRENLSRREEHIDRSLAARIQDYLDATKQ